MVWTRRIALGLALALCGCSAVGGPRFSPEIAASFARQPMRSLQTSELELYYPADAHEQALRVATRLTHCLETLRGFPRSNSFGPRF